MLHKMMLVFWYICFNGEKYRNEYFILWLKSTLWLRVWQNQDRYIEFNQLLFYWSIVKYNIQFSSVQLFSHVELLQPHESQHARLPCPSPTSRVYTNSCPSSQWCHPAISSSVIPFSCLQSLPASGSFSMSQLFEWGGQSIGVSASASVLPVNMQGWSPLGWTGWICLESQDLPRVFSNTTVQKHQFFSVQLSL